MLIAGVIVWGKELLEPQGIFLGQYSERPLEKNSYSCYGQNNNGGKLTI